MWRMPERMAYMSISIKAKTDYTGMLNNLSSSSSISGLTNSVTTGKANGGSAFNSASSMSSLTKNVIGAGSGSTTLSDYAAIKNGSYAKLMKAYYAEVKSDKSTRTEKDTKSDKNVKTDKDIKAETSKGEDDSSSSSSSAVNKSYNSKGSSTTMADALSSMYNQYI